MALDTGFVVASADFPMRPLEAHRKTAFCPANSEENSGQPLGLPRPRTVPDKNSAGAPIMRRPLLLGRLAVSNHIPGNVQVKIADERFGRRRAFLGRRLFGGG
jgi:hypothetical protein